MSHINSLFSELVETYKLSDKIVEAFEFVKETLGTPDYIPHYSKTMQELLENNVQDESVLIATICQDTVKYKKCSIEDIGIKFGWKAAAFVKWNLREKVTRLKQ